MFKYPDQEWPEYLWGFTSKTLVKPELRPKFVCCRICSGDRIGTGNRGQSVLKFDGLYPVILLGVPLGGICACFKPWRGFARF